MRYNERVPSSLLSVCIVNWNTRNELRDSLRALAAHPFTGGEQEILVIDNASGDGSAALVRSEFPGARLIANARNENYAHGTNQALEAARGDLLLLLNPDVQVTTGALDALADELANHPDAAGVAPRLVHADGSLQRSIRGFPEPGPLAWDLLGLPRLFPRNRALGAYRQTFFDYDAPGPAPQPMASCLLLTRKAVASVGPMDEARFPLFFNDVDWCLRAWQAGFTLRYTPQASVVHGGGASTKQIRRLAVWESHRALLRFYEKHYGSLGGAKGLTVRALVTLGAWARTGNWGKSLAHAVR